MKRVLTLPVLLTAVLLLVLWNPAKAGETGKKLHLMRAPDVYKDTVVFTYGDDLWKAPVDGGIAIRLTSHEGTERNPKFSPDGRSIAFSADYDGNTDVYIMNTDGGNITRLTYHPDAEEVIGWHPTQNKIMFCSARDTGNGYSRIFMISPDGTGFEPLIMHEAYSGSFSPDANQIAYTKVRLEGRTWKRYVGGLSQDIFIYDFKTDEETNITNYLGADRAPMWIGSTVYFVSDRNHTLNIYGYDTTAKTIKQMTFHNDYDVIRASEGLDKIVYEHGGTLWLFDSGTGKTRELAIEIRADAPETRPYIKNVSDFMTGIDISPSGKRALVTARGEIFTVPLKNGAIRNLTNQSGARDKDPVWSPDGKTIAFLSDRDGEYQIYTVDAAGQTAPVQLTQFKDGYRHTLRWSPDGKKIAFADQTLSCYYLDTATKKVTRVDKAEYENVDVSQDLKPIYDFTWSPDSRFLAYSKMDETWVNKIYIYALETGKIECVSNGLFNDFHPVFSKDGCHLFFVSNRRFDPTYCDFEWQFVYKDMAGIYCLTLQKDGKPLLPLQSDEETAEPAASASPKAVTVKIDFAGIDDRIEALPLPRGNYRYLSVSDSAIYYLNGKGYDYNQFEFRGIGPQKLCAFDFKGRKERTVIDKVNGYELSRDGSQIVYMAGGSIGMVEASAKDSEGNSLDLSELKMYYEPLKEWMQIYNEVVRLERDYYYDAKMKGINWQEMADKYRVLVSNASCRSDLTFIIGELIGELNTSHTYIFGGDFTRRTKPVNTGMLGVDWKVDGVSNRYQFKRIFRVPDWSNEDFPPLNIPGLNVKEGDYLLAVNGIPVTASRDIYSYFQDLAFKQVKLLINSKPELLGAREITVQPTSSEETLRYLDLVETNRKIAEKESNGEIGYIHFPDTFNGSAVEFPKYFYSQLNKKGIIVDGRFNGGGLDPIVFLERLAKKPHTFWTRRQSHDQTSPSTSAMAHLVCLTNRQAGSGGDELPYLFRKLGMGPVIGTRTWGGLVGVSMTINLIDGGAVTAPDYRIYDENGKWVVENLGVEPDITVELKPSEIARGYDAQLMKAIEVLKDKIKNNPISWPKHDPWPIEPEKKIVTE